ncbi:sulfite exporter TauE/SafE family protein [Candidatus Poribacteria bacterium]|nr:sulfite exporter TauE/SafE family protein [Candidatus Poribacteria bacterium]
MEKILSCIILGIVGGIVGGFLGLGAGTIIIPGLMFFMDFSQHTAQGTAIATMLPPITILAVMEYYRNGHVDVKSAAIIASGFILGGLIGAYLANITSPLLLRRLFGIYLLIIGLKYVFGK